MKLTKIVCTLGPSVSSVETLAGLLKAGMNVARLNFSHGSHEEHMGRITALREAMAKTEMPAAFLLDTKGPEIRTGLLKDGKDVTLKVGSTFTLTTKPCEGTQEMVSVSYEGFTKDIRVGNTVLIDDGLIELNVTEVTGDKVVTKVLNNGVLGQRKGVNLPNVRLNLPALAEQDFKDLEFGCKVGVDFVAPSFIRKVSDVLEVRAALDKFGGKNIKIISKIENQEGVDNFDAILEVSDGIMVARGDLGVEIPLSKIPLIQKEMIAACNKAGKPVITATQMLESMINNPRPTRAEVTDVANAILDGTDAVMLSGETAKGAYPVGAVNVMSTVAKELDFTILPRSIEFVSPPPFLSIQEALAKATVRVALASGAKAIVVGTHTGRSARQVRKFFPNVPILALADDEKTACQMSLIRGVVGELTDLSLDYEGFAQYALDEAKRVFKLAKGDMVVITHGQQIYQSGTTNSMRVLFCD